VRARRRVVPCGAPRGAWHTSALFSASGPPRLVGRAHKTHDGVPARPPSGSPSGHVPKPASVLARAPGQTPRRASHRRALRTSAVARRAMISPPVLQGSTPLTLVHAPAYKRPPLSLPARAPRSTARHCRHHGERAPPPSPTAGQATEHLA
jgi:hypothetical protein